MVKSESKRSHSTNLAPEDMQENIRVIFVYTASNFQISNWIAEKGRNIINFVPSLMGGLPRDFKGLLEDRKMTETYRISSKWH